MQVFFVCGLVRGKKEWVRQAGCHQEKLQRVGTPRMDPNFRVRLTPSLCGTEADTEGIGGRRGRLSGENQRVALALSCHADPPSGNLPSGLVSSSPRPSMCIPCYDNSVGRRRRRGAGGGGAGRRAGGGAGGR